MLKHLQQPPRSKVCGQYCLAMLTGRPLDKVFAQVGHFHSMRDHEAIRVLRSFGYSEVEKFYRWNPGTVFPVRALVKLRHPQRRIYHFVVRDDRIWYDPLYAGPGIWTSWSIYSYLPVFTKEAS